MLHSPLRRLLRDQRGLSLIETLIALAILGTALVVIMGAFSVGTMGVGLVDRKADAVAMARSQLEYLNSLPFGFETTTDNHVLISQVEIKDAEWVELYNPTNNTISLKGLYWAYYPWDYNWDNPWRKGRLSGEIAPHGFFLLRIDGAANPHGVVPDWDTGYRAPPNTLDDKKGSVGIFKSDPKGKSNARDLAIDVVAWGNVEYVKEGSEAPAPGPGESLQRRLTSLNDTLTWDTENNSADFFVGAANPRNSSINSSNDPNLRRVIVKIVWDRKVILEVEDFKVNLNQ